MDRDKLVVIGASYLQRPVVERARAMGLETHVFAWAEDAVVGDVCDVFHPISIREIDRIHAECERIAPRGVVTIASDLAATTVGAVTHRLGLTGNSPETILRSTHKGIMRRALHDAGVPVPAFVTEAQGASAIRRLGLPLVVKPTDRSGSRGVTLVDRAQDLDASIQAARAVSLCGEVIVEQFLSGREISVEALSWRGRHTILALTDKQTTGPPAFVEVAHQQPASLDDATDERVRDLVLRSLDALGIEFGASHSELLLCDDGRIVVLEVAGRMGGDLIGSSLVEWSTGYDYLRGVIEVALGIEPKIEIGRRTHAGVEYLVPPPGRIVDVIVEADRYPEIQAWSVTAKVGDVVPHIDHSAQRLGHWAYRSPNGPFHPDPPPIRVIIA